MFRRRKARIGKASNDLSRDGRCRVEGRRPRRLSRWAPEAPATETGFLCASAHELRASGPAGTERARPAGGLPVAYTRSNRGETHRHAFSVLCCCTLAQSGGCGDVAGLEGSYGLSSRAGRLDRGRRLCGNRRPPRPRSAMDQAASPVVRTVVGRSGHRLSGPSDSLALRRRDRGAGGEIPGRPPPAGAQSRAGRHRKGVLVAAVGSGRGSRHPAARRVRAGFDRRGGQPRKDVARCALAMAGARPSTPLAPDLEAHGAAPVGRVDVDDVAITLVRTQSNRVLERTDLRGVGVSFSATPMAAAGWRVAAGLGSREQPLELSLTRAKTGAPADSVRAKLGCPSAPSPVR